MLSEYEDKLMLSFDNDVQSDITGKSSEDVVASQTEFKSEEDFNAEEEDFANS